MYVIGHSTLKTICPSTKNIITRTNTKVRNDVPIEVADYMELAQIIAALQYENREHVLMFRGQPEDFTNTHGNTTIKPTILRGDGNSSKYPDKNEMKCRFHRLQRAEKQLITYKNLFSNSQGQGSNEVKRWQILRWSILQHYEICKTPLLDVTLSLRVAASFASIHGKNDGYVFVLGVPNVTGAITASMETRLQIIRLCSFCPPQAVRPHIQEGYLLGEYPEITDIKRKKIYRDDKLDFGRRLIAKFKFEKNCFWQNHNFPEIPRKALYPNEKDTFFETAQKITKTLDENDGLSS